MENTKRSTKEEIAFLKRELELAVWRKEQAERTSVAEVKLREAAEHDYEVIKSMISLEAHRDGGIYYNEKSPEQTIGSVFKEISELRGRMRNLVDENNNLTHLLELFILGKPIPPKITMRQEPGNFVSPGDQELPWLSKRKY